MLEKFRILICIQRKGGGSKEAGVLIISQSVYITPRVIPSPYLVPSVYTAQLL